MPTIKIMVGLPGSGKDYYIDHNKSSDDVVVSSDDIRAELGDVNDQSNNSKVFWIFYDRIENAMRNKKTIWVNATNVTRQNREQTIALAKQYNYTIECIVMVTPVDTCIDRDAKRPRTVGVDVIRKFENRFKAPTYDEGIDNITYIS